ncbi:MAG: Ribosomal protein methyltransferase [Gammaproteobacteria bacterium]|nr:Ribosomal protein methyltransferase [Gammaproteobacteria bacterium]
MTSFVELSFDLGALEPEAAEAACLACGAAAVTFVDSRDDPVLEPLPGEFRLWPATRLQALFEACVAPEELVRILSAALGIPADLVQARIVADRIWEREWLKDFHAMRFGERLWVCPHHERVEDAGAIVVHMDPGLAFGTGTHPTTALCLEWLDRNLAPGARVIDYGCGSGVLAVASTMLGALSADCFDIDPQALIATRDNAEANAMSSRVRIHNSADSLPNGADVLLSNILSGPLCELAPRFAALVRPGGALVLAGLMEQEVSDVTRAYGACFDIHPFGRREGWVSLSGRRL